MIAKLEFILLLGLGLVLAQNNQPSVMMIDASKLAHSNDTGSTNSLINFLETYSNGALRNSELMRAIKLLLYGSGAQVVFNIPQQETTTTTVSPVPSSTRIAVAPVQLPRLRLPSRDGGYGPRNLVEQRMVQENQIRFEKFTCVECCPVNCVKSNKDCRDCLRFDNSIYKNCLMLGSGYELRQQLASSACYEPNEQVGALIFK